MSQRMRVRARQVLPEAREHNPESQLLGVVMEMESGLDQGDWLKAAGLWPELETVRQQNPGLNLFAPAADRGGWNVAVDRASAAIVELEQVRKRDPLEPAVLVYLSEAYANVGRIEHALAEQDKGIALVPSELMAMNSVFTAYGTGDRALIEKNWSRADEIMTDMPGTTPYALRNDPAAVIASLRLAWQAQPRVEPASRIALWSAIFGDPQFALQVLREDTDIPRRRISALALWRPVMKDVRRLPGFKQLVRDWGLVDYWREHGWGDHCRPVGAEDFECH
jgi:hypothetical protein